MEMSENLYYERERLRDLVREVEHDQMVDRVLSESRPHVDAGRIGVSWFARIFTMRSHMPAGLVSRPVQDGECARADCN